MIHCQSKQEVRTFGRYLKWFLDLFGAIPISDRRMKQAIQDVEKLLKEGKVVCLFPEGTISRNGHLGNFRRGFEKMVGNADGVIAPFYLRGLWGDPLSRSTARLKELRRRRRNDVIIAFGKPMAIGSRAEEVKRSIFELSYTSWQQYSETLPTLPEAWIERAKKFPSARAVNHYCAVDWGGEKQSHFKMLTATILFSRQMRRINAQRVGILLPAGSSAAIINMAALMAGKEVLNLNYDASPESLRAEIEAGGIDIVYSAKYFLRRLEVKGLDKERVFEGVKVIEVEAMEASVGKTKAFATLIGARILPATILKRLYLKKRTIDDIAAVIPGGDGEGRAKAVLLTHRNLMANITQVFDLLNVRDEDVMLSTMPLYHTLGLTLGTFLPMIEGIPMACYPDPSNAKGVGRTVARYEASILFATPDLYHLYARSRQMNPLMFASLRLLFSGAQRLDSSIRKAFEERFRIGIYEGYSVTESTALASVNLPDILETGGFTVQRANKPGSVGMPLPGTAFRIVEAETMRQLPCHSHGEILIGGAQVMEGYLNDLEQSASVIVEMDGLRWYKTGDRGYMDEDGFLFLTDNDEE